MEKCMHRTPEDRLSDAEFGARHGFLEEMGSLDGALSIWALDACARGEFALEIGAPER